MSLRTNLSHHRHLHPLAENESLALVPAFPAFPRRVFRLVVSRGKGPERVVKLDTGPVIPNKLVVPHLSGPIGLGAVGELDPVADAPGVTHKRGEMSRVASGLAVSIELFERGKRSVLDDVEQVLEATLGFSLRLEFVRLFHALYVEVIVFSRLSGDQRDRIFRNA